MGWTEHHSQPGRVIRELNEARQKMPSKQEDGVRCIGAGGARRRSGRDRHDGGLEACGWRIDRRQLGG